MASNNTLTREERRVAAAVLVAVAALAAILLACVPTADAADGYDGEVYLYGYQIGMELDNPSQVGSVEWDFGDGSDTVTVEITADNPTGKVSHTYAAIGEYVVTATMRNTYTDGDGQQQEGETVLTWLYHIMGYPIITFDSQGGSAVDSIQGTSSSYVATQPADPTYGDYVFTGWYLDPECTQAFDWSTPVTYHITLYAGWSSQLLTVIFDHNNGSGDRDTVQVEYGDTLEEPENPSRTGFVFLGWKIDGALWDFNTPVTQDMTLVAEWADASTITYYVVTFDANGGTAGYTVVNVIAGNSVVLPSAVRDGFVLEGWYSGDTRIGVAGDSYFPEGNVTLTAHWEEDDGSGNTIWLILAIVFAICALVCLVAFFSNCGGALAILGTLLFAAASALCAMIHLGVIAV